MKMSALVLDPFGGSGSTYAVCELKGRRWIGMELGPIEQIIQRLGPENLKIEAGFLSDYRAELNVLFPPSVLREREKRGLWTPGNIPKGQPRRPANDAPVLQSELVLQEEQARYGAKTRKRAKAA